MKNSFWTAKELDSCIALYKAGWTYATIGQSLGRTAKAVKRKLAKTPISGPIAARGSLPCSKVVVDPETPKQPATVEDDRQRTGNAYWQREYKSLEKKYESVLKERAAIDQLVDKATELAPIAYSAAPSIQRPNRKGGGSSRPQSAVLLLSDTHIGQVIEPNQTLGFGRYDFPTFLARLKYLEESVTSILKDHVTTELEELVVCLGGDFLHGALNHSAEAAQKNTLFAQFYAGSHALAQFLRNVTPLAPKVRIYCTVGNHTRWGTQHKMPTENRYSNLDSFLYAHIKALTREIPTLEWHLDTQPFTLFEVQSFLFHLSHGDQLRGGDKALGIPNHAVGRMLSSTSQMFGKAGARSPHYYLLGHLHRSIVLPHSKGSVIVNGGFPGLDGYGLASGFSAVDPSQVFFLVHPRYGKTATYDILLNNAVENEIPPYDVPAEFPCL